MYMDIEKQLEETGSDWEEEDLVLLVNLVEVYWMVLVAMSCSNFFISVLFIY